MVFVEPKCRRVEAFLVGLSCATDASEVADEFESGEGVVGPGQRELFVEIGGRRVRDDVEDHIEAGV